MPRMHNPLLEWSGVAVELMGLVALVFVFPHTGLFLPAMLAIPVAYACFGWTPRRALSKRAEEAVIAVMMFLCVGLAALLPDKFLAIGLYLAYTQVVFRFSGKQNRYRGVLWSFLSVVVGARFSPDLSYCVFMLLYAVVVLVHLRELAEPRMVLTTELSATPAVAGRPDTPRAARRLWSTLGIVTAVLLLSVPIFLAVPRLGTSSMFSHVLRDRVTGFSEMTDLNSGAMLRPSGQLAFRLRAPRLFRLRGRTYDTFTGAQWQNSFGPAHSTVFTGTRDRDIVPVWRHGGIRQAYLQEMKRHTPIVFAPLRVHRFTMAPVRILRDPNGNLSSLDADYPVRVFGFTFSDDPILQAEDEDVYASFMPMPAISDAYLSLTGISSRTRRLAESVMQSAEDATSRIARAIEHFDGFEYSLNAGIRGDSPVDTFLFETRRGHCEFYATALTLMLRAGGVPARYVTGYLPKEQNRIGNDVFIFEDDAHAWVEAFVPERGWVPVDATPPGYAPGGGRTRWNLLQKRFSVWWYAYVVSYSRQDQSRLYAGMRTRLRAAVDTGRAMARNATIDRPTAAYSLVVMLLAVMLGARTVRRKSAPLKAARAARSRLAFYRTYERILRKNGFRRAPGETPLQFSRRASDVGPRESHERVIRAFYAIRYGRPGTAAPDDAGRIAGALNGLRRAVRSKRRR